MNNYFKQKNSNLTQRKNMILLIILLFLFNRYNLVKYFNMTFCFTKKTNNFFKNKKYLLCCLFL